MHNYHYIKGGKNLRLAVYETGNKDGRAILFIHGLGQSHLCWQKQFDSSLAQEFRLVAMDIRGHGMSDKPLAPENYNNGHLWAEDVAAVIKFLKLTKPILVASSYAGVIVLDYLKCYGEDEISGINFVSVVTKLNESGPDAGPKLDEVKADIASPDMLTNINAKIKFVQGCTAKPLDQNTYETFLCFNMLVPPEVLIGLAERNISFDDVLSIITVKCLVTHGLDDGIVLKTASEHITKILINNEASYYKDTGHMPFIEQPSRYNDELARFSKSVIEQ